MTHSNQWLQERADLLATLTEWRGRAEKAERELAEERQQTEVMLNSYADAYRRLSDRAEAAKAKVKIAEKGLDDIADFCGDEPGAARASFMATVAKRTLAAMENIDE